MELYIGTPFWPLLDEEPTHSYPSLDKDINCEVVVVGGGISGALCSYYMNQANIDTVLIDKNTFATGSTMINTSLLHYEIDTNLHTLSKLYGKGTATRYFQICRKSLYDLKAIIQKTTIEANYVKRKSLYVTKGFHHDIKMLTEYYSRKSAGFKPSFVNRANMKKYFNLPYSSGIFSQDGAEINPYLFARHLIDYNVTNGLKAYENTELLHVDFHKGYNVIHTPHGKIRARKVVFATGYEANEMVKDYTTTSLRITYTMTSKPITSECLWKDCCLIWEANKPRQYLRSTIDHRIVIGGSDTSYKGKMPSENLLNKKCHGLYKKLQHLFPDLYIEKDYCAAGVYATTKDEIGYVGEVQDYPNAYFLLGYGSNGILYSVIGAQIIRDLYLHDYHPDAALFSFYRS